MGKKYVVEIGRLERLYKASISAKGMPNMTWLSPEVDLTPYTEPDLEQVRKEAYQQGYEQGYKDGYNEPGKGKIQVGDEVNAPFGKAIVVNIDSVAKKIWLVYADGHGGFEYFKDAPTKTGRHFPEIAEVLRKMKETDNG